VGALNEDVVDAVIDDVFTDGIMPVEEKGDLKLCAHTVDAGDKDRIGRKVPGREKAAKTAYTAKDFRTMCRLDSGCDPFFSLIGCCDVDACVGVSGLFHGWEFYGSSGPYPVY
jgi:hypothetical protein